MSNRASCAGSTASTGLRTRTAHVAPIVEWTMRPVTFRSRGLVSAGRTSVYLRMKGASRVCAAETAAKSARLLHTG
jgi:hypothetical protein